MKYVIKIILCRNLGSGVSNGKMLLVGIIENNKIDAYIYFRSGKVT